MEMIFPITSAINIYDYVAKWKSEEFEMKKFKNNLRN